jgi:predicted nucleotidyltransferase component of viral defense system
MLHLESIEPFTLGLLRSLMAKNYLGQFVLVGGTALALQIGHRKSIDLDMFSVSDFDTEALLEDLQNDYSVLPKVRTKGSLICDLEEIKVDFIRFKYPFSYPIVEIDGIRLLSMEDIAPMKLDAITGRGSKKDFFDLFFLLEHFSLTKIIELYSNMYPHSTVFHVIKSLAWFEDAEPQSLPDVLQKKVTWAQVKQRIETEVAKL